MYRRESRLCAETYGHENKGHLQPEFIEYRVVRVYVRKKQRWLAAGKSQRQEYQSHKRKSDAYGADEHVFPRRLKRLFPCFIIDEIRAGYSGGFQADPHHAQIRAE